MKLYEVLERIRFEAANMSAGPIDPKFSDSGVLIEIILPRVLETVTQNAAKDPDNLNSLRRNHVLTFSNGAATLPTSVKEEFANSIYFLLDPSISYQPTYTDFFLSERTGLTGSFTLTSNDTAPGILFRWETPTVSTTTFNTGTDVNYTTDIITITAHGYVTGQTVVASGVTGNITGITEGQTLYIISLTADTFAFASTLQNAILGTKIDLTAAASGVITLTNSNTDFTGSLTINAVSIPELPTNLDDEFIIKSNLLEEVIALAANVISGKSRFPGLDYPDMTNG